MGEFEGDPKILERARDRVLSAFSDASSHQSYAFSKFVKYYELYRGVQSDKHYQGRANLFIPEAFTNIEHTQARILRSFAGIKTAPMGEEDVANAKRLERLLNWQTRTYNYKQAFSDISKDARIYGTGVGKVAWYYTRDKKFGHPVIMAVDPLSYYFDPSAVSRDEASFEIQRVERSIYDLKKNPAYFNLDLIKFEGKSGSGFEKRRAAVTGMDKTPGGKDKVEVLEYWGLFDAEGEDEEEYLITTAGNTVIRFEKNPFLEILPEGTVDEILARPFFTMKDTDVPHEFYGMGMVEPIEKLCEELNDTRNQRMDNVTLILDRMWSVLDTADVDENELVTRPGGIIHMTTPDGVTPLPVNDVTQSAYNEEQIIKDDIQRAIGIPEVAIGQVSSTQPEAAATILSLQESANIRFDTKISHFADAVRQAYVLCSAMNQKWLDKSIPMRLEENGKFIFEELDKDSIKGNFDVEIVMDTVGNKIIRRQEAFQLYAALGNNPMVSQLVNTRDLLESTGRKNLEEWLSPPPPAPTPPEEPKKTINVSLKGDLNALESDDIAVIMGAKQESADPLLRKETRQLMEGTRPEKVEQDLQLLEIREKLMEEERLKKRDTEEFRFKNEELAHKKQELSFKEKAAGVSKGETKASETGERGLASRFKSIIGRR